MPLRTYVLTLKQNSKMKKNTSLIIVAVVALAAGYLLGAQIGSGDSSQTKGDINAVNTYHELLTAPEYMAFQKDLSDNEEAIARTITTLQIVKQRIADFGTLAGLMNTMAANEPEVAPHVAQFLKSEKNGRQALEKAVEALQAAEQLKAGEKVDLKKALKNAEAALACIDMQLSAGKDYVQAIDAYIGDKDVNEHIVSATLRDLVASHCAVNATLLQDDAEMDYWSNMEGLVKSDDMAFGLE